VFWSAYEWTGKDTYLAPLLDEGPAAAALLNVSAVDRLGARDAWKEAATTPAAPLRHLAWQISGDTRHLERLYADQIEAAGLREYINTDGQLWSDRVNVPAADLQRARLGGVALVRNAIYPGHTVSWRFAAPAKADSVAILIPDATPRQFTVIAYNLETAPVSATMTGWLVEPGEWEVTEGLDGNGDGRMDTASTTRRVTFERTRDLELRLAPRTTTIVSLRLVKPGVPYWARPELGLDPGDVRVSGRVVDVTVHNVGSVPAPASTVAAVGVDGKVLATALVPATEPPLDLKPRVATVRLTLPAGGATKGVRIVVDPEGTLQEITKRNNAVPMP
jgi:hypothetical protein